MKKNVVVVVFGIALVILFAGCCVKPAKTITINQVNPHQLPYPPIRDGMSCKELAASFDQCYLTIDDYNKKVGK